MDWTAWEHRIRTLESHAISEHWALVDAAFASTPIGSVPLEVGMAMLQVTAAAPESCSWRVAFAFAFAFIHRAHTTSTAFQGLVPSHIAQALDLLRDYDTDLAVSAHKKNK